jgi:hypothetical protein
VIGGYEFGSLLEQSKPRYRRDESLVEANIGKSVKTLSPPNKLRSADS